MFETEDFIGNSGYIGQERVRKMVNFYIDCQRRSKVFDPMLICSQRGSGKTELARIIAKNLLDNHNQPKKAVEINCASVKSLGSFINNIVSPYISNGQEITIVFDEIHLLPQEVHAWLLSAFNIEVTSCNRVSYDGVEYTFDHRLLSAVSCSTNSEKLTKAFLSRLTKVELEAYTNEDLIKILFKNTPEINYQDNIENEIVKTVRHSPREAVKLGKNIIKYCERSNSNSFNKGDWLFLKSILDIRPLGLKSHEWRILEYLYNHGPQTLTCISSYLGVDSKTTQKDFEIHLLSEDLIRINQKRELTNKGREVLTTA